jgi:nucleotide-binding universal stress UspA family protein
MSGLNRSALYILTSILALLYIARVDAALLYSSGLTDIHSVATENDASNAHPVRGVEALTLAKLLASIQIRSDAEKGATIYLMSELDAERLAEEVLLSLRRLRADQDMHLVIYRTVGGSLSSKRYSTGIRVFADASGLNLIFGQLDTFQDDFRGPDRKLAPAGSRNGVRLEGGSIVEADWFEFKDGRGDWMVYPLPKQPESRLRM